MFAQLKTELLPPRRASPFPLGKSRTSSVWSPAPHWRTGPFPYPLHTASAEASVGHTPPLKPSPPPCLPLKARRNNTGPLQLPLQSLQSSLWPSPQPVTTISSDTFPLQASVPDFLLFSVRRVRCQRSSLLLSTGNSVPKFMWRKNGILRFLAVPAAVAGSGVFLPVSSLTPATGDQSDRWGSPPWPFSFWSCAPASPGSPRAPAGPCTGAFWARETETEKGSGTVRDRIGPKRNTRTGGPRS